jgi:hypothetical protein
VAKAKPKKPAKPAKDKPASKRGRQKGQQTHIPGLEPAKNKVIHPLALDYVRARDTRMEFGKEEVILKDRLIDAMQAEGLLVYEYEDINVVVGLERTLKVKRAKEDTGDE